jgi:hypothetical protein
MARGAVEIVKTIVSPGAWKATLLPHKLQATSHDFCHCMGICMRVKHQASSMLICCTPFARLVIGQSVGEERGSETARKR